MANKVTGKTDTSGALGVGIGAQVDTRAVVLIGKAISPTQTSEPGEIFSISGTTDSTARYGEDSPITKAVKVLIQNGVSNIEGMAYEIADDDAETPTSKITECLEASLAEPSISMILMDDNSANTITALKTHLALAETEDMFRYAVVAMSGKEDGTPLTQNDFITFAKTVADSRIFVPGAEAVDIENHDVEPIVWAAGLASRIMVDSSDPALPMNGVNILGFGGLKRIALETERKVLSESGVVPMYIDETGMLAIYRLVTSYVATDKIWQEGTTRFIADYTLNAVETMLRSKYKRTKNVVRILSDIRDDVSTLLQEINDAEIIHDYDDSTLSVTKDPKDRYGALIDYEIKVVTPLYTITINQHLKL